MRWDTLRRLAIVLADLNTEEPSGRAQSAAGFLRVAKIKDELMRNGKMSLLQAVSSCRTCKSKDPRDKIYSVLSMAKNGKQFPATYLMPWQSVYENFAELVIRESRNLEILLHCDWKTRPDNQLPSWVPDWTDRKFLRMLPPPNFRASGSFEASVAYPEKGIICTKAILFDLVLDAGAACPPVAQYSSTDEYDSLHFTRQEHELAEDRLFLAKAERIAAEVSRNNVYSAPQSAFLRTLICDRKIKSCPRFERLCGGLEDSIPAACWYSTRGQGLFRDQTVIPIDEDRREDLSREWDLMARQSCRDSRFFSTYRGYIGTGPMALRKGDFVAVLYGGNVPYALRKRDDGSYLLLGYCYVDGIMNGELLDMGLKVVDIRLS